MIHQKSYQMVSEQRSSDSWVSQYPYFHHPYECPYPLQSAYSHNSYENQRSSGHMYYSIAPAMETSYSPNFYENQTSSEHMYYSIAPAMEEFAEPKPKCSLAPGLEEFVEPPRDVFAERLKLAQESNARIKRLMALLESIRNQDTKPLQATNGEELNPSFQHQTVNTDYGVDQVFDESSQREVGIPLDVYHCDESLDHLEDQMLEESSQREEIGLSVDEMLLPLDATRKINISFQHQHVPDPNSIFTDSKGYSDELDGNDDQGSKHKDDSYSQIELATLSYKGSIGNYISKDDEPLPLVISAFQLEEIDDLGLLTAKTVGLYSYNWHDTGQRVNKGGWTIISQFEIWSKFMGGETSLSLIDGNASQNVCLNRCLKEESLLFLAAASCNDHADLVSFWWLCCDEDNAAPLIWILQTSDDFKIFFIVAIGLKLLLELLESTNFKQQRDSYIALCKLAIQAGYAKGRGLGVIKDGAWSGDWVGCHYAAIVSLVDNWHKQKLVVIGNLGAWASKFFIFMQDGVIVIMVFLTGMKLQWKLSLVAINTAQRLWLPGCSKEIQETSRHVLARDEENLVLNLVEQGRYVHNIACLLPLSDANTFMVYVVASVSFSNDLEVLLRAEHIVSMIWGCSDRECDFLWQGKEVVSFLLFPRHSGKQLKILKAMTMMGLYDTVYWLAWCSCKEILVASEVVVAFGILLVYLLFGNNSDATTIDIFETLALILQIASGDRIFLQDGVMTWSNICYRDSLLLCSLYKLIGKHLKYMAQNGIKLSEIAAVRPQWLVWNSYCLGTLIQQDKMDRSAISDDWKFTATGAWTLVLVGDRGNAKDDTCNNILQRKEFRSMSSSTSATSCCELERSILAGGQIIDAIDTPELFDCSPEPESVGNETVKCINMAKDGIHVLVVFSVETRLSREEHAVVQRLREFFGSKIRYYMIVALTGWDDLENNDEILDDFLGGDCYDPLKDILTMCAIVRNNVKALWEGGCHLDKDEQLALPKLDKQLDDYYGSTISTNIGFTISATKQMHVGVLFSSSPHCNLIDTTPVQVADVLLQRRHCNSVNMLVTSTIRWFLFEQPVAISHLLTVNGLLLLLVILTRLYKWILLSLSVPLLFGKYQDQIDDQLIVLKLQWIF